MSTPPDYLCARCGMGLNRDQINAHGGLCCKCSEAVEREVHHEAEAARAPDGLLRAAFEEAHTWSPDHERKPFEQCGYYPCRERRAVLAAPPHGEQED